MSRKGELSSEVHSHQSYLTQFFVLNVHLQGCECTKTDLDQVTQEVDYSALHCRHRQPQEPPLTNTLARFGVHWSSCLSLQ